MDIPNQEEIVRRILSGWTKWNRVRIETAMAEMLTARGSDLLSPDATIAAYVYDKLDQCMDEINLHMRILSQENKLT